MKIIVSILLSFSAFAVDFDKAKEYNELTKTYNIKIASTKEHDGGVVYISKNGDTGFYKLEEVAIDKSFLQSASKRLIFQRPSGLKIGLTSCDSEKGFAEATNEIVTVFLQPGQSIPVRVICFDNDRNYREAYSTIRVNEDSN